MKINLHTKLVLKGLFHSLLQFVGIFAFAWYNDCLFEMAVIYCCFFIFRGQFEKQYHASTTWLCTLYTFIVFFVISNLTPKKELSLLLIVAFTYLINFVSFHIREYLDLKAKFVKVNGIKICKGMSKNTLNELIKLADLNELESTIMTLFYCDKKSITYIAIKLSYSYDRIWQIKNEALNKINKVK